MGLRKYFSFNQGRQNDSKAAVKRIVVVDDASFEALVYSFGKTSVARIGEVAHAIDTSAIYSI